MQYLDTLLTLTGIMAISVISPGPNFAIVTSTALSVSRQAGVMTGLGLALASVCWGTLSIVGLSLILSHAEWLYTTVQIAGGAYLCWIGFKMIKASRQPQQLATQLEIAAVSNLACIGKGYLVSMTSPKSLAFYASIFVTFVPQQAPLWVYIALVMIPTVVAGVWYCGLALVLTRGPVQVFFNRIRSVLDLTIGLFLMGFGIRLLLAR